jgi:hypothetical protein
MQIINTYYLDGKTYIVSYMKDSYVIYSMLVDDKDMPQYLKELNIMSVKVYIVGLKTAYHITDAARAILIP